METKKIFWNRKLSCGHSRTTDINYAMQIYTKPELGNSCYCRICLKDVKIIGVEKWMAEK
ncbi:MAG: hypothetical protein AABY22_23580 [Nanoarchaeota archaeon]